MALEITMLGHHDELEEIAGSVAQRTWEVLTRQPGLTRLYPGYYVTIQRATQEHFYRRLTAEIPTEDGAWKLFFDGPENVEEFEAGMSHEILSLLGREGRIGPLPARLNGELSDAIHGALSGWRPMAVAAGPQ